VSIDEAWVDLSGTERLNGGSAAFQLARFQKQILELTGLTVSIGFAPNKFLAKMASDMDKPHGFFVIGRAEARAFLADKPVGLLPGVGKASVKALARQGFGTIGDLARAHPRELIKTFGEYGYRLYQLSQAEDPRPVRPERERKGMSHETTFARDLRDQADLEDALWPLCEKLAAEMRQKGISARVLILKLRRADFQLLTRRRTLAFPTQTARTLFQDARTLLDRELMQTPGQAYRLIGIGVADLDDSLEGATDLFAADETRALKAEQALDALRARFGSGAIQTGRSFRTDRRLKPPRPQREPQEP
ncbi:MAG: DNA polymerase IV, partial [Asticcacaulis sp.]